MKKPGRSRRGLDDHLRAAARREGAPRQPITLVLDRIRSLHNVGSIFRTADGFGVERLLLGGYTPAPPRPEIAKTALGAERAVPFEPVADPLLAVRRLQLAGVAVFALEQTRDSRSLYEVVFPRPLALVLGHETEGVQDRVLATVDGVIEIPMQGSKHSHNVAVAAGIALSEVTRQWRAAATEGSPPHGSRLESPRVHSGSSAP